VKTFVTDLVSFPGETPQQKHKTIPPTQKKDETKLPSPPEGQPRSKRENTYQFLKTPFLCLRIVNRFFVFVFENCFREQKQKTVFVVFSLKKCLANCFRKQFYKTENST
jgi:hypothetical protein